MTEPDNSGVPDTVQTAETVFETLDYLRRNEGATVTEVAQGRGCAKSTAHRHLSTLSEMEYVVRDGNEFYVGLRFLKLGQHARTRQEGQGLAKEKVEEIAEQTGERAQFLVEEHGQAIYLYRYFGEHAVRTDPGIGSRVPLHATAAGKSILAHLPESKRFEIIEQSDFEPITEYTITETDKLFNELETIYDRGYSFNQQENLKGLHAVGVPVSDSGDNVIGALSVSGPTHRLKREWFREELPDLLLGTANELELNIEYS